MKHTLYYMAALVMLMGSCNDRKETKPETSQSKFCMNQQLKKSTTMVEIKEQPIHEQLTLTGKVEYNENDLVAVKSLIKGIVSTVNFELGDIVKQGQVLAVVKSAEIQELLQERKNYQNQVELLTSQIQIKQDLLKDGMTSQLEVTALQHELQAAKIEVDKASYTLKMFRAMGDGHYQLLAPKNGYIVQKNISVGQSITTDNEDALFSISNLKEVWVMVNIYANHLPYIKKGDRVNVRTIAFPDRLYEGSIDKIYNVFDDNEHVIKARVVLENKDLNLMPGLSADIIIDQQDVDGIAFAIPNKAKVFYNNQEYIVLYKNDCDLYIRMISAIAVNEEYTFVEEKFSQNERVITSNALLLYSQLNK